MATPKSGYSKKRGANEPRVNRDITAISVRLILENGDMSGVVPLREALSVATDARLDLVEISPNAAPPVCKIMDYGKYRYQLQKKHQEAKKKQKTVETKEIKLRPNIDQHDLEIKMKRVHKFLGEGNKVKFTLRFRGREMAHQNLGMELLLKVKEELAEIVKIDHPPKSEGRQIIMIVSPLK
jgi:translation initiation factor IF-3